MEFFIFLIWLANGRAFCFGAMSCVVVKTPPPPGHSSSKTSKFRRESANRCAHREASFRCEISANSFFRLAPLKFN